MPLNTSLFLTILFLIGLCAPIRAAPIPIPSQIPSSLQSSRPEHAFAQNQAFRSGAAHTLGVLAGQSALGLGLGFGGFYLGGLIDGESGGMGIASGFGYIAGTSAGIWLIGKATGGNGAYWATLLGLMGGAMGGLFLTALAEEAAAPFLILGVSNLGGLAGYRISDGRLRTRVEYRGDPGSASARLQFGADYVLARW